MSILLKNPSLTTDREVKDLGFTVMANSTYDIGDAITDDLRSSSDLISKISSGDLELLNANGIAFSITIALQFILGDQVQFVNPNILTAIEFRHRFTIEERVLIDNAPFLEIKTLMIDFQSVSVIDLTAPTVIFGINVLVGFNLITQTRADEILDPTWNPM